MLALVPDLASTAPTIPATPAIVTSRLTAALEAVWADIAQHHDDLPVVTFAIASGMMLKGQPRWGHWHEQQWEKGTGEATDDAPPPVRNGEVLIAGELLKEGAATTLGILLHEAAHALASTRGIQDTSRQGRYHNTRFKKLAEGCGLTVEQTGNIGWAATTITEATKEQYAPTILALTDALTGFRHAPVRAPKKATLKPLKVTLACACRTLAVLVPVPEDLRENKEWYLLPEEDIAESWAMAAVEHCDDAACSRCGEELALPKDSDEDSDNDEQED